MVHKLAKALVVLFVSVLLGLVLMILVRNIFEYIGFSGGDDNYHDVILLGNLIIGPLLYAIPFAIIGFKIYPEPKNKPTKK